jgi:hypothetical protein
MPNTTFVQKPRACGKTVQAAPVVIHFDMFTRWLCEKCGEAGIDSWNKSMHDGLDFEGDYPNPAVWGDTCQHCCAPVVVAYTTPDIAPTAVFGLPGYSDENANMDRIGLDPTVGVTLRPSLKRDHDWSGGCMNLQPAPATIGGETARG